MGEVMEQELSDAGDIKWYDITIDGKQFSIASQSDEAHIRSVEKLVEDTLAGLKEKVTGQSVVHIALMTALNLADHLVSLRNNQISAEDASIDRLADLVLMLNTVLPAQELNQ